MKFLKIGVFMAISAALFACGGSGSDSSTEPTPTPEPTPEPGVINGPFSTGTTSDPNFVYFDMDAGEVLLLTEEEAAASDDWDIAFKRTKIYLNAAASTPVAAYFTGNNAEFYDADGGVVDSEFMAATAESELSDFTGVSAADIPAADAFSVDSEELIIGGGFYSYDSTSHIVSAAENEYFIVQSDGDFSKIRAKEITTAGRTMASIVLGVAHQNVAAGDESFMAEVDITLDAVACTSDLWIDLDTQQAVGESDEWDVRFPCITVEANTGAAFELHIAEDASGVHDSAEGYSGITASAAAYYGFEPNVKQVRFFDDNAWYQYNLNGLHQLWSQFGVYLIKTEAATYKVQITSYYNADGDSGNYSFRFESL
ncbi:HmuY family protein [Teredinibacter haidensis]|uniref:HmuY family protein n=1 Tax=Teredinibacter haidensis TaxID=2731755 RepID=UPI000948AB43|nr:HmuY family protein [Teredinibacter haidensis]